MDSVSADPSGTKNDLDVGVGLEQLLKESHVFKEPEPRRAVVGAFFRMPQDVVVVQHAIKVQIQQQPTVTARKSGGRARRLRKLACARHCVGEEKLEGLAFRHPGQYTV